MFAFRQQTLFFDKAIEIGRCHGPGVALVLNEGMNDRDRAFLVALDEFDAAEQRRRIGKAGDLGQKPADLDLGVDAGFELSIDLDHIVVIYQRRAVGLFGLDGTDVLGRFDRLVRKPAGRPELKAQAVFFNGQGFAQIAQQQRDEDLVGGNIQQRSFPRALAYRCKGTGVVALAIEPHPLDLYRQYVTRRRAALRRASKKASQGRLSPISQNGTAEVRVGRISFAERSGYQRVRAR